MNEETNRTGLCTIRELTSYLIKDEERRQAGEGLSDIWETPLKCELFFPLSDGYLVNVEIHVTSIKKETLK